MTLDELAKKMQEEQKSGIYGMQSIFNNNIESILELSESGMKRRSINEHLNLNIELKYFNNLVHRAKKTAKSPTLQKAVKEVAVKSVSVEEKTTETESIELSNETSDDEKIKQWHINSGVSLTIGLINELEKNDISYEEIRSLNSKSNIAVRKYLNKMLKTKKYQG